MKVEDAREIPVLFRYFMWANFMRRSFYAYLKDPKHQKDSEDPMMLFVEKTGICMSYWYGGLYVVIEGWKSLKLRDPTIDQLLKSSNVALLKRYRNGAFHFQRNWLDGKLTDFCGSPDAVQWVSALTDAFRDVLFGEMKRRTAKTE